MKKGANAASVAGYAILIASSGRGRSGAVAVGPVPVAGAGAAGLVAVVGPGAHAKRTRDTLTYTGSRFMTRSLAILRPPSPARAYRMMGYSRGRLWLVANLSRAAGPAQGAVPLDRTGQPAHNACNL